MKIARDESFIHYVHHKASIQILSMPPEFKNQTIWGQNVPQGLKEECSEVVRKSLGEQSEGLEIEAYRLCWYVIPRPYLPSKVELLIFSTRDSFTPDQNMIISPHPHCRNLYFALGGSFHSWKFLPNIGSYVVQMLHGKLEPEKAKRWAWDRPSADGAHGKLTPKRDLTDIFGYSDLIQQI